MTEIWIGAISVSRRWGPREGDAAESAPEVQRELAWCLDAIVEAWPNVDLVPKQSNKRPADGQEGPAAKRSERRRFG